MPLQKGSSKKVVSKNIKELMHSNKRIGQNQAIAIAMQEAGKKKKPKKSVAKKKKKGY